MRPFLGYETVEAVHIEWLAAAIYEGANAIFFHFSAFVVVVVMMMVVPFFVFLVFVLVFFVLLVFVVPVFFVFPVFVMPVFVSVVVCVLILLFIGMFVVRTLDTPHPSG